METAIGEIHEILNDYLVVIPQVDGTSIKVIRQEMLSEIAKKIHNGGLTEEISCQPQN